MGASRPGQSSVGAPAPQRSVRSDRAHRVRHSIPRPGVSRSTRYSSSAASGLALCRADGTV